MRGSTTLFSPAKSVEKNIEKRQILTQSIDESFLIDKYQFLKQNCM